LGAATDLDVLEALTARASQVSSGEALGLLLEGLDLVYGVPFDAPECGRWIDYHHFTMRAAEAIEAAALRAVELALAADDVTAARAAVAKGLVGVPGNELLYRARMRVEHHAGAGAVVVKSVYAELLSVLGDLAADSDTPPEPSPATKQLLERLLNGSTAG
jgi:hypothetical protein